MARQWGGLTNPGEDCRGYLLDTEGVPWGELDFHEEEDHWDEAAGGWRMPVTARYRHSGATVETLFPASRPACLAIAGNADEPWPGEGMPSGAKPDPQSGRVINGLLTGQGLWDVEVKLDPAGLEDDASPATRLLYSSGMHPLTRVLGKGPDDAIAYAQEWLRSGGMDPAGFLLEAHPSEKDL